jgi:hypothetical protein
LASQGLMVGESSAITPSSSQWGAPEGKECIECHQDLSPSLVAQWRLGAMGQVGVNCYDCHRAEKGDTQGLRPLSC